MNLFAELRRRNVFRVAGVYAVAGWLIAQVAGVLENALVMPAWFDTVVVSLLLLGLPVALIFAWAFELTPEGVKLTANVPESESIAPKTGRKLDYAILAGVALIVALFIGDRLMPEPPPVTPPSPSSQGASGDGNPHFEGPATQGVAGVTKDAPLASIAVLPFADLSPGKDQQYFSDGIAEEVLNVLARVEGLKVASRTSAFQFRGDAKGIPVIAGELGVRHILEGSVRKSGDSIRVTAQLIDASADEHLWSENFNRTLTAENIFAIQDEIARAIVEALREKLGARVGDAATTPVRTRNVDAYELYLRARALFQSRRDLGEADHLLEEATKIDPDFADALAIRAAIHQFGGEYGARLGDEHEARARGKAFAAKALAVAPENSLALAIAALSDLYDGIEGRAAVDYEALFAAFDRALKIDPGDANALNWLGIAHSYLGENEKAAAVHRRCIAADPALAACRSNLVNELLSLGRREEASAVLDAALDAGAFAVGPGQMVILAELKRRDAFLLLSINVPALKGFRKFNALYDALSDPGDDPALATEVKALFDANEGSLRVHAILNALGDYSAPSLITFHWLDAFAGYRRSAQFKAHMRASGAYDYWRKHGFPPPCRAVGADDFECR
jgi:TolB-like protein